MVVRWIKQLALSKRLSDEMANKMLAASLNPRFHKAHEQLISRFLNAYVRNMFDSVSMASEMAHLKQDGNVKITRLMIELLKEEANPCEDIKSEPCAFLKQKVSEYALEVCEQSMLEAKRKSHQFSQLSQSVLKDQRNNLLLSKIILMAKRNHEENMIQELSMAQFSISPADAFAAKLLEDSDDTNRGDTVDILCFASLAEGIRSVANSQMNHFFQMRRFERERNISSFNGVSSEEIIEQLELDVSLVLKYDTLVMLEAEHQNFPHSEDLFLSDPTLSDWK